MNDQYHMNADELRKSIISQLPEIAMNCDELENWNDISPDKTMEEWMDWMNQDGHELDNIYLRLAAEVLHTRVIIYHVVGNHSVTIEPKVVEHDKEVYLLYFEEGHFYQGHYQSIVPVAKLSSFMVHFEYKFIFKN